IGYGIYCVLNGVFPPDPKENPKFYHWQRTKDDGSYLDIFGFRKTLKPPTVISEGMLSPFAARTNAFIVGIILILVGTFILLSHFNLPPFAEHYETPDF